MTPDPQARFVAHALMGLVGAGVRDLVVSPGSRSTPLLLQAIRAEERGDLRIHDVLDERAAAFFALGLARAGAFPALLCTSGSAAAHYLPALVEANASGLALVVVSANRPPELQETGANQTIDQTKLFGDHVAAFVDLGLVAAEAAAQPTSFASAERRVRRVSELAKERRAPVHVDLPARKPFEGDAGELPRPTLEVRRARRRVDEALVDALAARLARAERTLITAGPTLVQDAAAPEDLRRIVASSGALLLADTTSQLAACGDPCELALRTEAGRALIAPDFVLQLGDAPIGRGHAGLRVRPGGERWVVSERGWPDAARDATTILRAPLPELARALADALERSSARRASGWGDVRERLAAARDAARDACSEMGEAAALRGMLEALTPAVDLVVGNSLAVRLLDLVGAAPARVHHQRGASGIDGNLAGACGVAALGRPTLLALGDVSVLHDVSSLALAARSATPVVVVALDDAGGRIFEQLPVHGAIDAERFERHFAHRHEQDLGAIARAFGLHVETPRGRVAVRDAVRDALARDTSTFLWVRLDPAAGREDLVALDRAASAALVERA